jgi:putative adenylate-forming enzyme
MALEAVTAYCDARRKWTPGGLRQRQDRLWRRLQTQFAKSVALKGFAEAGLNDIPIIGTDVFRSRFSDYCTAGISHDEAMATATRAETGDDGDLPGGLNAGFSTGTGGGTRGLFITSAAERATYSGRLAGKLVALWQFLGLRRIAVCLRAPSRLYERSGMRFFTLGDAGRDEAVARFDPHLLIAPPQVLLDLAASGHRLPSLRHLYYGAETLNAHERAFVTERLGHRPDPIYQATEGFLGAPCAHGTLHLNEDGLIIEREDIGGGRFRPIVTDLLRHTQLVVRLRLDDILKPCTCPCGSLLQAIEPVEGRIQDIWRWEGQIVFPAEIETAIGQNIPAHHRWLATGGPSGITYACDHDGDASAVAEALARFGQPLMRTPYDRAVDFPKRRHVRWQA